jgi:hypothetical protein
MSIISNCRLASLLIVALSGIMVSAFLWSGTRLSIVEQQLVGKWATLSPRVTPMSSNGIYSGTVIHPRFEWEFCKDRRFRVWAVSEDDASVRSLDWESRWRVLDGKLRFEGTVGDIVVRDLRRRMGGYFGIPYARATSRIGEVPFQLTSQNTLELRTQDKAIAFRRHKETN